MRYTFITRNVASLTATEGIILSSVSRRMQHPFYLPWQDFPAWQWVIWLRTFFIVRQWGRLHCQTSPLACSRRWHLCACSRSTSCCWISLRFSGSAVGGAPAAADAAETWVPTAWAPGTIPGAPPTGAPVGPPTPVCDCCVPWKESGRQQDKVRRRK